MFSLSLVHTVYGSRHRRGILIRVDVQRQTADTLLVVVAGEVITEDSVNVRVKARVHLLDILSLLKHGRFWYHQEPLAIASLTFSTPKVDAPTFRMLIAALISRSW